MTARDRNLIQKIVNYAVNALGYVHGSTYESFISETKTVYACAFSIGQIGELASIVSEEAKLQYTVVPWRNIRGMRNKIVHDYDHVDMMVLWGVLIESLPALIKVFNDILAKNDILENWNER